MGWASVLGTIGAGIATALTGGAAAPLIPLASNIGSAIDSASAEKKAAKQQVAGAKDAAATLSPYNARGVQATNTLAGLLGMPDLPGWSAAPAAPATDPRHMGLGLAFDKMNAGAASRAAANPNTGGFNRLADIGGPIAAQQQTQSSYGGTKRLQAPNGDFEDVPLHEVPHWLKLGAVEAVQ